jgi:hypothetical protein
MLRIKTRSRARWRRTGKCRQPAIHIQRVLFSRQNDPIVQPRCQSLRQSIRRQRRNEARPS